MRPLTEVWSAATSRLMLIYGGLFAIWCVVLLGAVQFESSRYLSGVIDTMLQQRITLLARTDPSGLKGAVENAVSIDPAGVMWLGLFDAHGQRIAGNVSALPAELPVDGAVHVVESGALHPVVGRPVRSRAVVVTLPDGRRLVAAKDSRTIDGLGAIMRRGLLWGLTLTLIPGLLGGFLLSRAPARRIRQMQLAAEPIQRGDLSRRLPVSGRGDEIDLLAGIVNTMLAEIERLMGEVKGVCDNIAHDLRTPLTHLRARLYRTQQQLKGPEEAASLDACLADIDALMARFRALLRISELEDGQRSACFQPMDLADVMRQVHEFYGPLAEDRGQRFELDLQPMPATRGDPQLLFEALANLVGNAIKFTPAGGLVTLRSANDDDGGYIEVGDSGPGIPEGEREAVLLRFYRGDGSRSTPGSGLGLSIVSAIARLHGYGLEVGGDGHGARIRMRFSATAVAVG